MGFPSSSHLPDAASEWKPKHKNKIFIYPLCYSFLGCCSSFGTQVMDVKTIIKGLPAVFGASQNDVRNKAKELTVRHLQLPAPSCHAERGAQGSPRSSNERGAHAAPPHLRFLASMRALAQGPFSIGPQALQVLGVRAAICMYVPGEPGM